MGWVVAILILVFVVSPLYAAWEASRPYKRPKSLDPNGRVYYTEKQGKPKKG